MKRNALSVSTQNCHSLLVSLESKEIGGAMDLHLGCGHWGDDEFVERFETLQLSHASFNHADHVRLAWIYVQRFGAAIAEDKLLAGIRGMAEHAGAPQRFLYATTVAWARLVAAELENDPVKGPFEKWICRHEQLLDKNLLDQFYSTGLLKTEAACADWVEPDRKALTS